MSLPSPLELLDQLESEAPAELEDCTSPEELEDYRVKYLGRSGMLRQILSSIGEIPSEQRPQVGKRANALKQKLSKKFEQKQGKVSSSSGSEEGAPPFDPTLPGRVNSRGSKHPLNLALERIVEIFERMGYTTVEGPEIETDFYNFEALNIPADHPARDMHDTLYLEDGRLLRTHTSPVQVHVMEAEKPPLQIIAPGRTFRRDAADMSHSPVFHQVEGLWVDRQATFADLKGTLELFVHRFFGPETRLRFRPSYFPFTEPSAEVDIQFEEAGGEWLEILGAGMVDPEVFKAVGYDTDRWQGFAFGMGVERLAMLKYGIDNLQLFYENDLRFLNQF